MSKLSKIIKENYEIFSYLFFGVLTTLVNYVTYILSTRLFSIDVEVSTIIAWVISVIFAYITNKLFVFKSKTNKKGLLKEISSFTLARIFSLILDVLIMFIFVSILHFNDLIIKILSNVIVVIVNYVLSKLFIFKK